MLQFCVKILRHPALSAANSWIGYFHLQPEEVLCVPEHPLIYPTFPIQSLTCSVSIRTAGKLHEGVALASVLHVSHGTELGKLGSDLAGGVWVNPMDKKSSSRHLAHRGIFTFYHVT